MKPPERLQVNLNGPFPRWPCSVSDGRGTANGGFWRGFRSHAEMFAWLAKNGYIAEQEGQNDDQ
jgi:hypothetical protein